MNFVSKYLHSGNLKLIFALSVPVVIAFIFLYSQHEADVEMAEHNKEAAAHPTAKHIVEKDFELKEVDDNNHVKWHLLAESGEMSDDNKSANLTKVTVEYFDAADGKTVKMRLVAPQGVADESTKYVKLTSLPSIPVTAACQGGKAMLTADQVELMKKNQFKASGNVNIEWPKVAKVSGNVAEGLVDLNDFKNFKISGNTHAQIGIQ